jgi:hypothetical protein
MRPSTGRDAARKHSDHKAALDLTGKAWRLWQRLQTAGFDGRRTPVLKFETARDAPQRQVGTEKRRLD